MGRIFAYDSIVSFISLSLSLPLFPPLLFDKTLSKLERKDTVVREIQINYLSGEQFAFKVEFENLGFGFEKGGGR